MTTTATALRRVLLLHGDPNEASRLKDILTKAGFADEISSEPNPTLADFFDHPPSMLLVAEGTGGRSVETLARDLKVDPLLGRLPIVFLIRNVRVADVDWETLAVDDYIATPYSPFFTTRILGPQEQIVLAALVILGCPVSIRASPSLMIRMST